MTIWDSLWVTALATFVATLPAVFIGLWAERRYALRNTEKSAVAFLRDATSAGSVIYNTRDWANAVLNCAQRSQALHLSNSVGSASSLTALAESAGVPQQFRLDLLVLADHVARLHLLVDPHMASQQPLPASLAQVVRPEAEYVANVARGLIERATDGLFQVV